MDRKINDKFKHCWICNGNIAYTACVAYPIDLCKFPCRNSFIWWSDNHKIVKFQYKRNTLVLPKCYTHYQERCKDYCQECHQPYIHLVYLPTITSDTNFRQFVKYWISRENLLKKYWSQVSPSEEKDIDTFPLHISTLYAWILLTKKVNDL